MTLCQRRLCEFANPHGIGGLGDGNSQKRTNRARQSRARKREVKGRIWSLSVVEVFDPVLPMVALNIKRSFRRHL